MKRFGFILFTLILSEATLPNAQTTSCSSQKQYCFAEVTNDRNLRNPLRMRAIQSRNSTLAGQAEASTKFKEALSEIELKFQEIEEATRESNKNTICGGIYKSMVDWTQYLGYVLCSFCSQTLLQDEETPQNSNRNRIDVKGFQSTLEAFSEEIERVGKDVADDYGLGWSNVYSNIRFELKDRSDKFRNCELYRIFGILVDGKWNIATKLYNIPSDINAGGSRQQHITEYLRIDSQGSVKSLPIRMPECHPEGFRANVSRSGEATIQFWHGSVDMNMFPNSARVELEENEALGASLDLSAPQKELVQDVDANSNAAILLLPVVLALFPIGAFQEVSFFVTVLYSIATDFISVLPIFIKGVELLLYSRNSHDALSSTIYGSRELGTMEAYVSRCVLSRRVRSRGVIYIFIALISFIVGLTLEIVFWRRKNHGLWKMPKMDENHSSIWKS